MKRFLRIVRRFTAAAIACTLGVFIGIHYQYVKTYGTPLIATEFKSNDGKVIATEVMFDPAHILVATPNYTRIHQVIPTGQVKTFTGIALPPTAVAWLINVSRIHNTIRSEEGI